jgi:hypothetical protein
MVKNGVKYTKRVKTEQNYHKLVQNDQKRSRTDRNAIRLGVVRKGHKFVYYQAFTYLYLGFLKPRKL